MAATRQRVTIPNHPSITNWWKWVSGYCQNPDDDVMTAIKPALGRPIFGDAALLKFLTRSAARP
jgi:hypothetical protein